MKEFMSDLEAFTESWWPYFITLFISLIAGLRVYFGGVQCPSKNRIDNENVIITGASTGIGLETAKELAGRGANIILAVRNEDKGNKALNDIQKEFPNANIVVKLIDVSDFKSIHKFAKEIEAEYDKIDILINNAGINNTNEYIKTADDNELILATNYLGPFLLTHLLLPLLNKSGNSRVINISSAAHLNGKICLNDLNLEQNFNAIEAFAQSKLALILFTKQMTSLLKKTRISFLAVNPGIVRGTEHLRQLTLHTHFMVKLLIWPWTWLFLKTPKQGCQSVVFAAVEPSLSDVSGCYLSDCEIQNSLDEAKNIWLQENLYKKTCEIANIDNEEIMRNITGTN